MALAVSLEDRDFRRQFEAGSIRPADFDHRAHLRLAYVYLVGRDPETACQSMRTALLDFLDAHSIDPGKYHETMTRAWILAVHHFMQGTSRAASADDFIDQNRRMLDSTIMLTHYSRALLFSDNARETFIEPDLDPIPRH